MRSREDILKQIKNLERLRDAVDTELMERLIPADAVLAQVERAGLDGRIRALKWVLRERIL